MKITYCIECAEPLAQISTTQYRCPNQHDFWNNPKGAVAVVVLKDDKILVSKRAHEPFKGQYDLPGGFLQFGEDPLDAAVREIDEETGMQLQRAQLALLASYTGPYWENESVCDLIYLAKDWSGVPIANDDSAALEWKDLSFLESAEFNPPYAGLWAIIKENV